MRVVPQAFFENPSVRTILADGLCCVLMKEVREADEQQERYLSAHAFSLVRSGTLRVNTQAGDFVHVAQDQLVFLPRGIYLVTDLLPDQAPFSAMVYFVDDELLAEFKLGAEESGKAIAEATSPLDSGLPLVMNASNDVRLFSRNLLELYGEQDGSSQPVTRPKLLEFLHLLLRSPQGAELAARLHDLQHRRKLSLLDFMEANFSKPLRIEDFAYLTGRSVSTFQRDFKAKFGVSPKSWLIERRLSEACKLLGAGRMKVAEVSRSCGYENVPHFLKSFRRRYGISPGQYGIARRTESFF